MNFHPQARRAFMLATTALGLAASMQPAMAQEEAEKTATAAAPAGNEDIVVIGSQIVGREVTAALPVTVLDRRQIDAIAPTSGDDLFRAIPQAGNVSFNSSVTPGSSNSVRGDANSISLRGLGTGNTLVLLNGRRTVLHPITQGEANVPVFGYNTNAIPVAGVRSLEVLRDGASAIYGTDAVAGVINTVLQDRYEGARFEAQYGHAQGTSQHEGRLAGIVGHNFRNGRGNFTLFGSVEHRSALLATDQDYTTSADKRPLFAGTEFEGATSLDRRNTRSAFGVFQTPAVGVIRSNGIAVTGSTGLFRYSPIANPTCGVEVSSGLCLNAGGLNANTDRNLRTDTDIVKRSVIPEVTRYNAFGTFNYDLSDDVTFFSELGLYAARSVGWNDVQDVGSSGITIYAPANSYYNPFGPTLLANGQPNPNRLPGLSANVPAEGLPILLNQYNAIDIGQSKVIVNNLQYRILGGLKGNVHDFNWETALLYSQARVTDRSQGLSATNLQAALARTTPDAYNPFNGGSLTNPSNGGDPTPSSPQSMEGIMVWLNRTGRTTLAQWDFKVSRPDLVRNWAGDIGVAAGVEVRRETYSDDRDPRIDGTITYTDPVSGAVSASDVPGTSTSADVRGRRTVSSGYVEFAVPLISPEQKIPLVERIEVQLAGRAENYSDVGSVAKPKIAGVWDVGQGLRLRSSWSQGFRAPNLEQLNLSVINRVSNRQDFIFCEANLRTGAITSFNNCSQQRITRVERSGNSDLKPENSTSFSYGAVLEATFLPERFGRLTLTADVWNIRQKGIVGALGDANALALDYLLRTQGSFNPAVHRLAPTPEEAAQFAGTGLTPVGVVSYVEDKLYNLSPQEARGIDFSLIYRLYTQDAGNFHFNLDVSKLQKLYQSPSAPIQQLLDARNSGLINPATPVTGGGDLIGQNGNVRWRWAATFNWQYQNFNINWFANYTGSFNDTGLTYSDGTPYRVKATTLHNASLSYTFEGDRWEGSALRNTRFLVGVRNLFDKDPPLTSTGYHGAVYNPNPRYFYVNVSRTF